MNLIKEFEDNLKEKQCQWIVNGDLASVRFDGELKEIVFKDYLDVLSVKLAGSMKKKKEKGVQITINEPIEIKKEDDEEKLQYTVLSRGTPALIAGYLKQAHI